MPRPAFPKHLREFQGQFATEKACQDYLVACRWPEGFACPRCRHGRAYRLTPHRRWQGVACRYQVSLTAGTILHNTKTPLTVWFWAAYLAVTDRRGISALLLHRQLGLRRYETAGMLLDKLRRAMVNTAREPLHGEVELDDTWVGGHQSGLRGSRQLKGRKAAIVAQLQVYLAEFVFRHNRRRQPMAAFQTLLGLGTARTPTRYRQIRGARDVAED